MNETRDSSFALTVGRGMLAGESARAVVVRGGRIVDLAAGAVSGAIDLGDVWLAPGFVDIHTHGLDGVGPEDLDADGLRRLSLAHACHGVTSFVVSTMTAPEASLVRTLRAAAAAPALPGARFVGVHLEGPFLDRASAGAQNPQYCRPANLAETDRLLEAGQSGGRSVVRMMTIAPEHDEGFAVIRRLRESGVVVALGHSAAGLACGRAAVDAGARVITHLFNGMPPFHHRAPGLVGLALTDPRLIAELIVDGIHLDAAAVRLAFAAKGAGALAGSTLTLDAAVRRMHAEIGVPLSDAVAMASTVPAQTLGLEDAGRIAVGAPADLVAFDGEAVRATWVAGRLVWRDPAFALPPSAR